MAPLANNSVGSFSGGEMLSLHTNAGGIIDASDQLPWRT